VLYSLYLESVKTGVGKRDNAIDRMYSLYSKGIQIKNLKGSQQTKLEEFGIYLEGAYNNEQ
jgi:hypothetical protein